MSIISSLTRLLQGIAGPVPFKPKPKRPAVTATQPSTKLPPLTADQINQLSQAFQSGKWAQLQSAYQSIPMQHVHPKMTGGNNGLGQANPALHAGPSHGANPSNGGAVSSFAGIAFTNRQTYGDLASEGIRAGELTGYRAWRIVEPHYWWDMSAQKGGKNDYWSLRSLTAGVEWKPGEVMEGDVREYGVYCFSNPHWCRMEVYQYRDHSTPVLAIGKVKIWGEIIEHDYGYRAQYAKLVSIEDIVGGEPSDQKEVLQALKARYEVAA